MVQAVPTDGPMGRPPRRRPGLRSRGVDQRTAALALTPEGYRTVRRILARRELELDPILELLSEGERQKFVETAEQLLRGIDGDEGERDRICRLCDHDVCGHWRGDCPLAADA